MKFKKLTALGIAVMMTVSVLTACGNTTEPEQSSAVSNEQRQFGTQADTAVACEKESKEIVFPLEETMEFTGYAMMNGDDKLSESNAWKVACERANISFELTEVRAAEVEEKGNLIMAGGDYPDMLFKSTMDTDSLGMDGLLISLEDLIREYMPNLTTILDDRDGWKDITAGDGHIYALPQIYAITGNNKGWLLWYNQVWLDNLDLEAPSNMEEMYEVLKAFKEQDANGNGDPNDEIPITFASNAMQISNMITYIMPEGLYWTNYFAYINDEIVYSPLTDTFRDYYLAPLAKWYQEGFIDRNCFVQTHEQLFAIGKTSNVYGMFVLGSPYSCTPEANNGEYHLLKPFEGQYIPISNGVMGGAMAITDRCENPEVLLAWADYFYTEEGGRLAALGIEDENYVINEDGTFTNLTPGVTHISGAAYAPCLTSELEYNEKTADPTCSHILPEILEIPSEYGAFLPDIVMTEDEDKRFSDLGANIKSYVDNYVAQVVVGDLSLEDSWEEFHNTLLDMGAEEYQSLYQSGYENGKAD